jgi:hypothetical protein
LKKRHKKAAARIFSGSLFCVLGLVGGLFAQLGQNEGFDFGVGRGVVRVTKCPVTVRRFPVQLAADDRRQAII